MLTGIISLLVLFADIWAILNIAQSSESIGMKAVWIVAVLIFPVVGLIVWYFMGPKAGPAA